MQHKIAKDALKKEKLKDNSSIKQQDYVEENNTPKTGWMPDISLTTGLTLVGITLTAVDLFMRYQKSDTFKAVTITHQPIREIEQEDPPVRISTRSSKSPKLIGME